MKVSRNLRELESVGQASSDGSIIIEYVDKIVEMNVYPLCTVLSKTHLINAVYCSKDQSNPFLMYLPNPNFVHHDDVYKNLLEHVLKVGNPREDRTGTGTISTFGYQMRFDISNSIPVLTTKHIAWKSCVRELLWFLRGSTNAQELQKEGVHIWDGNTNRSFLDKRGLDHLPEGDIGAGYGFQWRHFGATYKTCKESYKGQGIDQIRNIIQQLKSDPFSRRIFLSAWNPSALDMMALPPCHVSAQFYVCQSDGKQLLSCHVYQRSVDCFLGLPFNILSYATLTYILATMCDMMPNELIISTGDTHIYYDHIDQVKEQINRQPLPPPIMQVREDIKYKSIDEITLEDINVIGYFHHPAIRAKMSA